MVSVSSRISSDTTEGSDTGLLVEVEVVMVGAEAGADVEEVVEDEEEEEVEEEVVVVVGRTLSESNLIFSSELIVVPTLEFRSDLLSFVNNIKDCEIEGEIYDEGSIIEREKKRMWKLRSK